MSLCILKYISTFISIFLLFLMTFVLLILSITLGPSLCQAQKKLDLGDIQIKGELHGDNRLKILARDKNKIKNYVKFRTNFRKEIIEGLPKPQPKQIY